VRSADNLFMLDYWGLALKQASDGRVTSWSNARKCRRETANGKSRCAVRSAPPRLRSARLHIGWDANAADFAMTLGEFYCKA